MPHEHQKLFTFGNGHAATVLSLGDLSFRSIAIPKFWPIGIG
jgi:hypothetical protein